MKKLINKIKSWFKPRVVFQHVTIYERCDSIAKQYGTRCGTITIGNHGYPHKDTRDLIVWVHLLERGVCENMRFDCESGINEDQVIATFELMLISNGYKKQ